MSLNIKEGGGRQELARDLSGGDAAGQGRSFDVLCECLGEGQVLCAAL